ncbi:MAG: hypothetical protein ACM3X1_04445 [Ignavibacteriales bacterium]
MATEPAIIGAAVSGLAIALLYRGILPYLLKCREAEQSGEPAPSFSKSYLTTFVISVVGGLVAIMMAVSELELKLIGISSVMTAASVGFSFTYSILSVSNNVVDLRYDKIALMSKTKDIDKVKSNT